MLSWVEYEKSFITSGPDQTPQNASDQAPMLLNFFMLNSAEHEFFPANKSQIANNCKFFLAKHSWAWKFLC